jgi:hypothetical protein
MPVLYMVGKRSTPSAHGVARLLAKGDSTRTSNYH